MSGVAIEPCSPEDRAGLLRVWSITYNNGEPFDDEPKVFGHGHPFVAKIDGRTVGGFGVMPISTTRGPATLQNAGVLAVAVMPQERRSGVGKAMMRYALRHYREQGWELASLYGFSEQYYRAFGYETAGRNTKLTVDSARLPRFAQDLDVRLLGAGDVEAIRDCHTAFARRHSGSILRNDFQWERVLSPKNHRSLYVAGDPAEAYAVIQHRDAFWETQWVEEIVWNTKRGYDSILAVLKGVAINKSALSWFEPSNSLYLAHYYDHGCNVEVERTAMFRVLHVPNALKALKPESTGEFTIRVLDGEFPENEGPWQVRFDANGVSVEKASSAGLCLDVRHFAQAFLGEPSLRDLINLDLVEVSDDADAVAAERLLTPSCTHCADFF